MNNFGDWLCIEILMVLIGWLIIFIYKKGFIKKLLPMIAYSSYIWNIPLSIFLMNFVSHFFYVLTSF